MPTLFAAVTVWGLLLTIMRLLGFPAHGFGMVTVLLLAVGAGRIVLRRLNHPRLVSMGTGLAITLAGEAMLRMWQGMPGGVDVALVPMGLAYGAFADLIIGGTRLVAQWMRFGLIRRCR